MRPFRELPIRTKLIRLMVGTCGIVLVLAMLVLIVVEAISIRRSLARSVGTLADVIAFNSTASLAFVDPADAAQVLEALRADPYVDLAVLFDSEGNVFALYGSRGRETVWATPGGLEFGQRIRGGFLHHYQAVVDRETHWGTLYIRYRLTLLRQRMLVDFIIAVCVIAGAIGASYLIASVVQRFISVPIVDLAKLARRVSREHDFSLRVEKQTEDEVGELTDAFNEMLGELGQKEVALRRSEERLRLALGAAQTGIWRLNTKTGELEVQGRVFSLLEDGESCDSIDLYISRHVHPEDRPRVEEAVRSAAHSLGVLDSTHRVVLPDGSVRYYNLRGEARKSEGQDPVMLGVTIDVTAAREAEEEIKVLNRNLEQRVQDRTSELRSAMQEIESFSYSVSHDLRAPLRSIDGFSRILVTDYGDRLDGDGKDFLNRIRQSAQKMGQLIEDMLMLSRVTRQEMKRQDVDLTDVAREILTEFKRASPGRRIETSIAPGLQTYGDGNLLYIALQNLLSNAWKFTSKKEGALIEVGWDLNHRAFFVRDNGAGFDMTYATKLFGAFQRLHGSSEFDGTGIGLATVKRIVNRHGGRIWAEAKVGEGATFFFTLSDS